MNFNVKYHWLQRQFKRGSYKPKRPKRLASNTVKTNRALATLQNGWDELL